MSAIKKPDGPWQLRLNEPAFTAITIHGGWIRAGAGASVAALVARAAQAGLAGLEGLAGISDTVGGLLRRLAGDGQGTVSGILRRVEVMNAQGDTRFGEPAELPAGARGNPGALVFLSAEFELRPDQPDAISQRLRKAWIVRRALQRRHFRPAC
jgi:UDP-N-acetylmuramate dehydrogenase